MMKRFRYSSKREGLLGSSSVDRHHVQAGDRADKILPLDGVKP